MGKCSKDRIDIYYRQAKEEGWRARSAFKLLQIEEHFQFFKNVTRAVDICAAPGSWSQVLVKELRKYSKNPQDVSVVAVDIQTMAPIDGVTMIQGDITEKTTADKVTAQFKGRKAELVVCDGAPDVTGQHDLDEFLQNQLLSACLDIVKLIIEDGGVFITKIFKGKDIRPLISEMRKYFAVVDVCKPSSSRASSTESFLVCQNFEKPCETY